MRERPSRAFCGTLKRMRAHTKCSHSLCGACHTSAMLQLCQNGELDHAAPVCLEEMHPPSESDVVRPSLPHSQTEVAFLLDGVQMTGKQLM